MKCVKGLYIDGVAKHTLAIPLDDVTSGCARMWRRLQDLVKPETLLESPRAATLALHALHDAAAELVLAVLHRSLTTANPGGEPRNEEAKRQLLFFANSLFNTTMSKPPPVARMKSWSGLGLGLGLALTLTLTLTLVLTLNRLSVHSDIPSRS